MDVITEAIKKTRAYYCLECGKCTGVCPVSKFNRGYSPRSLLIKALRGNYEELVKDKTLWTCLTCGLCDERCPSDINYIELIKTAREVAHGVGEEGVCSHGGAFQSLMRIMTSKELKQNRLEWISEDLKVASQGDIVYFVGCLPYFDVFFSDIGVSTLDAARSTVKILNYLGINPVLLADERCCGHDLLWIGDVDNFKRLAKHNIEVIEKVGAKKVIFSCPECYRTFKKDYPTYFGELKFDVQHIVELIAKEIANDKIKFGDYQATVTYQDPCRLGRHLGIYDEPRQIMYGIPKLKLNEMEKSRNTSICCGVSAWMNCDTYSKALQVERLKDAKSTGADTLVVACPKCEIHLKCAMSEDNFPEDQKIEIKNLTTLACQALKA